MESVNLQESASASVIRGAKDIDAMEAHGKFMVSCYDQHGNLKWEDEAINLITDQGKSYLFNAGFRGTTPIGAASWYVGIKKTTAGAAAADLISSHAGWTEAVPATDYSGNRKAVTFTAPTGTGTVSMTHGTAAAFTASGTWTAYGCILVSVATGGIATDILYSVSADFGSGSKALALNDVLNVTYTTQLG